MAKFVTCKRCEKWRQHHALGYCKGCYNWVYEREHGHPRKFGFCTECGEWKELVARRKCSACYQAGRRKQAENEAG